MERVLLVLCMAAIVCVEARVPFDGRKTVSLWNDRGVDGAGRAVVPPDWVAENSDSITTVLVTAWHITWNGGLGECGDNATMTGEAYRFCGWKGNGNDVAASPTKHARKLAERGIDVMGVVYNDMSWVNDTSAREGFGLWMLCVSLQSSPLGCY